MLLTGILNINNLTSDDYGDYVCTVRCITSDEAETDRCLLKKSVILLPDQLTEKVVNLQSKLESNDYHIVYLYRFIAVLISVTFIYICIIIWKAITNRQRPLMYRHVLEELKMSADVKVKQAEQYDFDVFLSYCQKDTVWVRQEMLPFMKRKDLNVFTEEDVKPGQSIVTNIATAI